MLFWCYDLPLLIIFFVQTFHVDFLIYDFGEVLIIQYLCSSLEGDQ